MTQPDQSVAVTDADREAAALIHDIYGGMPTGCDMMRAGEADTASAVQAFARHRLATEAEMAKVLADRSAVHTNMLRGGIAKPLPINIWHLYGNEALIAAMPANARHRLAQADQAALRDRCAKVADAEAAKANEYYVAKLGGDEGMDRNQCLPRTASNIAAAIRGLSVKGEG